MTKGVAQMTDHEWREHIDKRLARIEEALLGNGKPGLKTEIEILKHDRSIGAKAAWLVIGALATALVMKLI